MLEEEGREPSNESAVSAAAMSAAAEQYGILAELDPLRATFWQAKRTQVKTEPVLLPPSSAPPPPPPPPPQPLRLRACHVCGLFVCSNVNRPGVCRLWPWQAKCHRSRRLRVSFVSPSRHKRRSYGGRVVVLTKFWIGRRSTPACCGSGKFAQFWPHDAQKDASDQSQPAVMIYG